MDTASEWRGGQRQLQLLVAGLRALGHQQVVACPADSPLAQRVPVVHPMQAGNHPLNLARLRSVMKQLRPQVVAAHTSHAHSLAVAAGLAPVVHRRVDALPGQGALSRAKYRRARGFICVSHAVAGVLRRSGLPESVLEVVHSGVQLTPAVAPAALGQGRVVLAAGALVPHKGHSVLARAAVGLNARVLVAGEGAQRGPLTDGPLELLGQRDDLPSLLRRAQVFVHPSLSEGLGQVVAEALWSGTPVVASAVGGLPELLDGVGLLVPPDDPEALRSGIQRALAGQHPPAELGRDRVARGFSAAAMVRGTERIYAAWGAG